MSGPEKLKCASPCQMWRGVNLLCIVELDALLPLCLASLDRLCGMRTTSTRELRSAVHIVIITVANAEATVDLKQATLRLTIITEMQQT